MKKAMSVTTIIVIGALAACKKPTSTYSYVHTQNYSHFNFRFNGNDYQNIGDATSVFLYGSVSAGVVSWGDTTLPSRQVAINFQNSNYTFNIRANSLSPRNVGLYKIGRAVNYATFSTYIYGTLYVSGIGNSGAYYYNTMDTTSSYVIVTETSANETKGTFVLRAVSAISNPDTINVTGDFDLLTP